MSESKKNIVTLTTDFGTSDGFVGAMKGVILSIAPFVKLLDITHDISPQDINAGAWALKEAVPFFPKGTIHLAVVDPGVGSERRPILLQSHGQFFVGPDNGLFSLCVGTDAKAWVLDCPELFLKNVSSTFHGRDLFASVVGHLAKGKDPKECGTRIDSWVALQLEEAKVSENKIDGQVIHIDRFGNLVTNIRKRTEDYEIEHNWEGSVCDFSFGPICDKFCDVNKGEWVAYMGSSGFLEIAIRNESAKQKLLSIFGDGFNIVGCRVKLWKCGL